MKPIHAEDLNEANKPSACSTEGRDGGCSTSLCSKGLCPGTIMGGIFLLGWGLYALGSWVWGLIAG